MRGLLKASLLLASTASAFVVPPPQPFEPNTEGYNTDALDEDLNDRTPAAPEWHEKPMPEWFLPKSTAEVEIDISDILTRDASDSSTLKFNLEVKDSSKICGDGNFLVNGQKLKQTQVDNKFTGEGQMSVEEHDIQASWEFECVVGPDDRPMFRFVTFTIDSIDNKDVAEHKWGFVSQFQQQSERTMIMLAVPDLAMKAPSIKDDFEMENHEPTLDEVIDDLEFLKHQMRELKWQIGEKKRLIRELTGEGFGPELSQCDSLLCVCESLLHKAKGFASHIAVKVTGHGRPGPPDHKGPHGPFGKHGNHTKHPGHHGNHTWPHPPKGNHSFHHPPPHFRPPHRLPVCRFPPPPHHGKGPHGPPHGPQQGPPPPPPHKGSPGKHGDAPPPPPPPPGHGPPSPHHDGPPPPPAPPGSEGPPPSHDGPPPEEHQGPEGPHGGPPSPFSNEHDHFDGHQGPPPPPFGYAFHFVKVTIVSGLVIFVALAIFKRFCCKGTRAQRQRKREQRRADRRELRLRRKELREAARKHAWREWALGLVRQMGVALPMSDEEEADYEEKRAMLLEEAHYHAECEVGSEIRQLRRAANVVGDMVDEDTRRDVPGMMTARTSFETQLPDYRSEAGDLPSYADVDEEVGSLVSDGYRPGMMGHQYTPSNSSDAGSVRGVIGDAKE